MVFGFSRLPSGATVPATCGMLTEVRQLILELALCWSLFTISPLAPAIFVWYHRFIHNYTCDGIAIIVLCR